PGGDAGGCFRRGRGAGIRNSSRAHPGQGMRPCWGGAAVEGHSPPGRRHPGYTRAAMLRRLIGPPLRLAFHLLYHQLAWAYDTVAWLVSGGAWRAWARATLPYLDGRR